MAFKVLARNIDNKNKKLILGMVKVVTDEPVTILDLDSFVLQSNSILKDDVLFLFGTWAISEASLFPYKTDMKLPDIRTLSTTFSKENGEEEKEKISAQLVAFKETLKDLPLNQEKKDIVFKPVTEDPWPQHTANDVKVLEANLRAKGFTIWEGVLDNGKTLKITIDPSQHNGQSDIEITFAELYALKTVKEVLPIKELKFGSASKDNK